MGSQKHTYKKISYIFLLENKNNFLKYKMTKIISYALLISFKLVNLFGYALNERLVDTKEKDHGP